VLEETPRMIGPIIEISSWRQQRRCTNTGIVGGLADNERPARVRSNEYNALDSSGLHQVVYSIA
jgi:hypothetical protein